MTHNLLTNHVGLGSVGLHGGWWVVGGVNDGKEAADLIESGRGPGCVVPGLLDLRLLLRQRGLELLDHRLGAEHRKRTAKKDETREED